MNPKNSYAQILKASSIMGSAASITLVLGMIRTKFVAMLIGTTGIGLQSSFTVVQGLIGTLAGLGIQSSAVREVAAAIGKGDEQAIARTVLTLRRISWITGLVGMASMMLLSPLLSQLTFGSGEYTNDIAALGLVILFANLTGGQMALIQGMRRISDMARANIIGAALGTVIAIGWYSAFGLRGIVPTLITVAGTQLILSWYFARHIPVKKVTLSWKDTFKEGDSMVRLGIVFMWNGLMGNAVNYFTITLITQKINLGAVGIYSAAYALSGLFVNFVLGAMAADYYPRLTGVANEKKDVNRMVNEQTEIGLLLAAPGLLVTMALSPWIIRVFYTSEFLPAIELMEWFILGCLGKVISWPMGFVLVALNKTKLYFIVEMSAEIIHVLLITLFVLKFGLTGVAIAFAALLVITTLGIRTVIQKVTGFAWTKDTLHIIMFSTAAMISMMIIINITSDILFFTLAAIIVVTSTIHSYYKINGKLGERNQLMNKLLRR